MIRASIVRMPTSIYLLSFCTATAFTCASLLITLSALIGFELAPDKTLATLPIALQFLAVMSGSVPASMFMARYGRRAGFMLAACIGIVGALLALWAVINKVFWVFCVAAFLFGSFTAFSNFYRFAAVEAVDQEKKNRAISYVMAGGVIAAFFGPNLANHSQDLFVSYPFAGAFVVLICVYLINLAVISRLQLPANNDVDNAAKAVRSAPLQGQGSATGVRPLRQIVLQPVFIIAVICEMFGYGSMNLVMSSTPLAMHANAHGMGSTAQVIQWHVVAMFLPSFFTGKLIDRFGIVAILLCGVMTGFLAVIINLTGQSFLHFVAGLVALGIAWNFLFVGGTTLLTTAYQPNEKNRAQAANDFVVFSFVTITALSAGSLHHLFGWAFVNLSVVPLYLLTLLAISWLVLIRREPSV